MARALDYPSGQAAATGGLIIAARFADDLAGALQLARQATQIPDIPGRATRACGRLLAEVLAEAGDLAAAEQARAATLAQVQDAGDLNSLGELLAVIADADLRAGRAADAAAHLREAAQIALQTGTWFTILHVLEGCGLCAPRPGGPPTPSRPGPPRKPSSGKAGSGTRTRLRAAGRTPCATPGACSARTGPARPSSAARR
jgi:hypothetical protein